MISVFKKEWWEVLRWTPLGMLLGVVSVWMTLPSNISSASSFASTLASQLGLAAAIIAIGLGLLQSVFDTRNDARAYLLHRPVRRTKIWWGKFLAGGCLYALSLLPAFLFAVFYLESQGLQRFPTTWWQVLPAMVFATFLFLLHPMAIWIVNRDARWTGTKFLPAIAMLAIVMFNSLFVDTSGSSFEVIVAVTLACLCAVVVLVGSHHAFCYESMLPPQTGPLRRSWPSKIANTLSAVLVLSTAGGVLYETFRTQDPERVDYRISLNSAGDFQQIKITRSAYNGRARKSEVRSVDPDADFHEADRVLDERLITMFQHNGESVSMYPHQPKYILEASSNAVPFGHALLVSLDSNVLIYNHRGLEKTVAKVVCEKDGDRQFKDLNSRLSFTRLSPNVPDSDNPILAQQNGVYQFDSDALELRELYVGNSTKTCLLLGQGEGPASLWTLDDDVLREHIIEPVDSEKSLMAAPEPGEMPSFNKGDFELPLLKIVDSREFKIQPLSDSESMSLTRNQKGEPYFVRHSFETNSTVFGNFDNNRRATELGSFTYPKKTDPMESMKGWIFPPGGIMIASIIFYVLGYNAFGWIVIIPAIVVALLAAIGAWWVAGYRGLGRRSTVAWIVTAALLGPGVWWAIIACYKRLVTETCTYCAKAARVELDVCEHCQRVWAESDLEGIEVFERTDLDTSVAL